jgi:hypothetical protein
MEYRYKGGSQNLALGRRRVASGDVIDLSDDEAAALADHPDWEPADAVPLADLTKSELVELADMTGVPTSGTKADLIERLTPTTIPAQEG